MVWIFEKYVFVSNFIEWKRSLETLNISVIIVWQYWWQSLYLLFIVTGLLKLKSKRCRMPQIWSLYSCMLYIFYFLSLRNDSNTKVENKFRNIEKKSTPNWKTFQFHSNLNHYEKEKCKKNTTWVSVPQALIVSK